MNSLMYRMSLQCWGQRLRGLLFSSLNVNGVNQQQNGIILRAAPINCMAASDKGSKNLTNGIDFLPYIVRNLLE